MQLPRKANFPCRYVVVAAVQRLVRVKLAASRYNSHTHHSEVFEQAGWSGAGWHSYSCLNVLMQCVCECYICVRMYARLFRVGECVCVCSVILVIILKYDSCGGSARFTPSYPPSAPQPSISIKSRHKFTPLENENNACLYYNYTQFWVPQKPPKKEYFGWHKNSKI